MTNFQLCACLVAFCTCSMVKIFQLSKILIVLSQLGSLVAIDDTIGTIDVHPMRIVHSILYQPYTACIGCASVVTVFSTIDQRLHTCFFFLLPYNFCHSLSEL